jgi:hypothetical protein
MVASFFLDLLFQFEVVMKNPFKLIFSQVPEVDPIAPELFAETEPTEEEAGVIASNAAEEAAEQERRAKERQRKELDALEARLRAYGEAYIEKHAFNRERDFAFIESVMKKSKENYLMQAKVLMGNSGPAERLHSGDVNKDLQTIVNDVVQLVSEQQLGVLLMYVQGIKGLVQYVTDQMFDIVTQTLMINRTKYTELSRQPPAQSRPRSPVPPAPVAGPK